MNNSKDCINIKLKFIKKFYGYLKTKNDSNMKYKFAYFV